METFPKKVTDYFTKAVTDMVKYREENNITRGDFLDLLIAMKNHKEVEKLQDQQAEDDLAKFMAQIDQKTIKNEVGKQGYDNIMEIFNGNRMIFTSSLIFPDMTIELMAAQCFLFFVGGFEGASDAIMLMLFELAQHPHIQNKLREEILSTMENHKNKLNYEMMKKMPYLEMVIAGDESINNTGEILHFILTSIYTFY